MVTSTLNDEQRIHIQRTMDIKAPIEIVFQSILEQIGPRSEMQDGTPMPLKLEAWPGGRWYRDLGNNTGHLWGHVQVIKPPTLLEIVGPMFMSYPVASHLQYRLVSQGDSTQLNFLHRAIGDIEPAHREGVSQGWNFILDRIKALAER